MFVESVKNNRSAESPLITTAKRYWLPELTANSDDPDALTLVFLHSTSFHKETWEPSIEKLLTLSAQAGSRLKIREAWALDCPNHGEAAHLNKALLNEPDFRNNFTCEKYAISAHRFLLDAPHHAAGVDFRKRNLIGIGHSLGGNTMLMLQHLEPRIPFKFLIIVEPLISPAGPNHLDKLRSILVKGAQERRDEWPNREQAVVAMKKRVRTAKWDPRITELFVQHALVPQTRSYENGTQYQCVTLACTRDQEVAMYRDAEGPTKPVQDLRKVCKVLPVHLILGAVNDFMPARVHAAILDPQYGGVYASIHKIDGVGHLIPQEAPDTLGTIIYDILSEASNTTKSRL